MENKYIDMHSHTCYSDGELTPDELIKLAIENNVGTLAITDHDTLEGVKRIDRNKKFIVESGIKIINGIELSAKTDKGRMHILGYDIDLGNKSLNDKMGELKDNSINSVIAILAQIKKDYGITFHYSDLVELFNAQHNLGRPDIAKLCVKYGYATDVPDAFDKYLIDAYDKTRKEGKGIKPEECISLINGAGGIPVLAHPKSLELDEIEFLKTIKQLIEYGLKGIEVYHSTHTKDEMDYYLQIAKEYNLLISAGSDYHGKVVKPDIELGSGKNNNLCIKKLSIMDSIK